MRVKTGFARKRAHSKIHAATKGYRMTKRRLIRVAKEAILHAGAYAYVGRKDKKSDFRRLWIVRINGALTSFNLPYSKFIKMLKDEKIEIDRKIFSEIIQDDPETFGKIVKEVNK